MNNKQGLMNLGNTCFINSTIQCLNNLKLFKDYLFKYSKKSGLVGKFTDLLKALNNNSYKDQYMKDFINAFYSSNNLFKRYEQDDSHIFLVSLLNSMHKEMQNYKDQETFITQLFGINIDTITKDNYTKEVDIDSEPSFSLSLPIQNKYGKVYSSLEECLQEYQKPKQIEDSYTRKTYTEKTIIKQTGNILVINLQRVFNGRHIRDYIKYEEYFTFNNTLYELMGLVKHIGNEYSGHKIALCKDSTSWYEFDDYRVTKLSNQMPNENLVFLLFYQKMEDNLSNSSYYNQIKTDVTTTSYDSKDENYYSSQVIEQYKEYEKKEKENENIINDLFKQILKNKSWKNETDFLKLKPSKIITKNEFQKIFQVKEVPDDFLENKDQIKYFNFIYSYKKFIADYSKTRSSKSYNKYKKY